MSDFQILRDLGLVLIGAAAFVGVGRLLRLPPLLAYVAAGLALGPVTGVLEASASLHLFAELGVALLLFLVGLELSIDKIRVIGRAAALAGLAQVALTTALGWALARVLGFTGPTALLFGLVAAFSSTVVVVKLLDRSGDLTALHGRLSIGILLLQDVLVAVVLTLLSGLGEAGRSGDGNLLLALGSALLGILGLAVGGAVAGRWLLPGLFRWMAPAPEGTFVVALSWAFAFIVAAEALHVSVELGAFIAGVVLAQLPYNEELRRRTHPLVDFFLAVFFVSLGAGMEMGAVAATWPAALALAAFVLTVKPVLVAALLGALGEPRKTSARAGLILGQVSEFAFVLAGLAIAAGLVGPEFLGLVGTAGLVSIGSSALLVPRGASIVETLERLGLLRFLPGRADLPETPTRPRTAHVVVVGMNTLGRSLVERFRDLGERVLAVDTDPGKLAGLRVDTLAGDLTHPDVVEAAALARAALVVSAVQIEDVNSLLAHRCHELGVPVSIHAFDPSLADELLEIGADHVMVSKLEGIRLVEDGFRRLGVLG